MRIDKLYVENQMNPIGMDTRRPTFDWMLSADEKQTVQVAYQIIVEDNNQEFWDSGRVESADSVAIAYAGVALESSTRYRVGVTVWDNYGNQAVSNAWFETGLFSGENFQARWITFDQQDDETACPVFRKKFHAPKKVTSARVYASALGVYEIKLNGQKVGDHYFAPGWTNYHKRLQYQTYGLEDLLDEENSIELTVGNGWYKGIFGFTMQSNIYGNQVAALAEIHLNYEDGTKEIIGTDETWQVEYGSIRSSEIYLGEVQDTTFQRMFAGTARITEYPREKMVAQESEPVRITKRFPAVSYIETPKGEKVLDFGQNLSGFVSFQVKGEKGQQITIKHAETLDKDGNFYPDTLRQATSHDVYVLNGELQTLCPHFTFHGFRYIAIEGLDNIVKEDFVACVMHTDMQQTGTFTCSHAGINQLQSNIEWGQRSNFLDIPTDCPQRDERLGWTGDAQIFSNTAMFNFQSQRFFQKWLRDLASEQSVEHGVPHVVPNILGDQDGAAAWSDAATIIPWNLYLNYGDKTVLEQQYASMKGWVDYITSKVSANGLWQTGFQYGDWLALDKEESSDRTGATDRYFVANAYYLHSLDILRQAAAIIGEEADAEHYDSLYHEVLAQFQSEYITGTGRLVSETQTACVLALHFNLIQEEHRARILKTLIVNLAEHKNHLSTGFVGTPYLCHVLSENGEHELATKVFLQEDYPSWLYAVNKGATTIWERWNSILPDGSFDESGMNSLNHYAYGSIGDWMYRKLAGINPLAPGYKKIKIAPMLTKGLTWLDASYNTAYGKVRSAWKCEHGMISIDIEIPANTTAVVILPEKADQLELGSGKYHYEYATETDLRIAKYSLESTLEFILSDAYAVELFDQLAPGMLENPLISFAHKMTITELTAVMPPEGAELYYFVINKLNEKEKLRESD